MLAKGGAKRATRSLVLGREMKVGKGRRSNFELWTKGASTRVKPCCRGASLELCQLPLASARYRQTGKSRAE
jgi:hypothetical protein